MEKEKLEGLLIDYIDNKLNTVDRQAVEQELVRNPDAYKLYEELKEVMHIMDRSARLEPSQKLKNGFENILQSEITANRQAKTISFQPAFYRVAAAVALLVIGGGIGFFISKQNDKRLEEIAKQMEENQKLMEQTRAMMAMMSNDQSASQRIQGVNVAMQLEKPADEIVKALVKTMNEDPSSNVRLAALDALSKFIAEEGVRKELISSLSKQKDPVVQIALIQLMVKMKEKGVVNDLKRIVDDARTMQAVKDEAYSGILRLS
jgi:anti-sigma factor RsiW